MKTGAPRLYPDVVTLTGPLAAHAQYAAIKALVGNGRAGGWAVKESYLSLDLSPLGFRPLFDTSWFVHCAPAVPDATTLNWRTIADAANLAEWTEAWGTDAPFTPALLSEDGIVFLAAHHGTAIIGGAILNRVAGVIGLSNVFAMSPWENAVWRDLLVMAARLFAGLKLVGYDSGADLKRAVTAGFEITGPLRIWLRPMSR